MATKFVYSEREISEIVAFYQQGTSLEVLAEKYNKSVASVRMKLVKLGVYQKQAASTPSAKQIIKEQQDKFSLALSLVGEALL
jgi:Zn-dependent peptidase ImmA (M78 family)